MNNGISCTDFQCFTWLIVQIYHSFKNCQVTGITVHPWTRIFSISDAAVGSHLHLSQNSSFKFKVEFKEKLYEKYSKSKKYLIPKEEYYKILENLKTATEVSSMKSHHQ